MLIAILLAGTIDVGGHRLFYKETPGPTPAIVFESGGGDDSTVWDGVVEPIRDATGARLIQYDRAGFGKSEPEAGPYSIEAEVDTLEKELDALNVRPPIVFVASSYGGFLVTLYAARHPERVGGIVLVDANLVAFFNDAEVERLMGRYREYRKDLAERNPALARGLDAFPRTIERMRKVELPSAIPVIDIVAQQPPVRSDGEIERWRSVHAAFDEAGPKRKHVDAAGGHFVMRDNPKAVVDAVVEMHKQVTAQK